MAFLSLGLNLDEPQAASDATENLPEEKLRLEDKPSEQSRGLTGSDSSESVGWGASRPPSTGEDARASMSASIDHANGNDSSARKSDDQESPKNNWSETGLSIIQSVLRNAEKQTASPSNGSISKPALDEVSALPALEHLRKIAEGIPTISDSLEGDLRETESREKDRGGAGVLARATAGNEASAATAPAQIVPPDPKSESASAHALVATGPSETAAKPQSFSLEPAPPTEESEPRAPVSSLAPEFLSPVMEELRRKLAEAGDPLHKDRGETGVLARLGSASSHAAAPQSQNNGEPIPAFATFKFGELPGRGLLYSFIGHEVAMFAIFLFITYVIPNFREQRLIVGSLNPQDHIIYLPEVGGGTQGEKSAGGGESKPQQASAAPAHASKGFAYPGAQAILSNPPNPTNAFQTVLHPLAVRPEPLKKLVPLPNIVQMAETRLPTDLVSPKVAMPHYEAPVKAIKVRQDNNLRRNAKWNVPVKAPQLIAKADMPKLAAAEQPLPVAPKVEPKPVQPKAEEKPREVEKPAPTPIKVRSEKQTDKSEKQAAPPSTAQLARLEMHGKSAEPLLSLSPAPLPTKAKVPAGEARGRFAIAPGGKLNPNSVAPGKSNGTPSESPATGQEKSQAANATSELASNQGVGTGHNPAAGGGTGKSTEASGGGSAGAGSGSGNTVGSGVAAVGTGNGRGSAGAGAGKSGHGAGTGSGAGSGAGSGSFPGIAIQGGEGNEGNSEHSFTVAQQTPYQMTIVATASSGGGLADYGVFEDQRVYTVYVPMQRTPQEADPTWTLQYALEDSKTDSGGQLIAPTPVMREWPQIPADLEKAYSQQQVVVAAILGTDGKLTHFSVKQSPDPHVSTPVTQALAKWVFRPAQQDSKPVAVKILLGIPLN